MAIPASHTVFSKCACAKGGSFTKECRCPWRNFAVWAGEENRILFYNATGGTVGAWCAYFLRRSGLDRVVLLEKRTLGQGASSRAAGVVRTQGGTSWAVQLGDGNQWQPSLFRNNTDRSVRGEGISTLSRSPVRRSCVASDSSSWPTQGRQACGLFAYRASITSAGCEASAAQ